ncbi:MAG TPA: Na/Pi symporter, partial [Lentisphaeria bacterium]|nr:Na/Pi symporter [Lentisphaeria bacterium]
MLMSVFTVFGGLAIFIYGMKLMSDGLHKAAGERMRVILRFFSSNRFVAILAGTIVTAVIQSSSATTVMVIGFVNAGLLSLLNSLGIIFGANIGTTITAQLVAFDIEWLIMPCIIIGVILTFVTRPSWRGCGE